MPISRRRLIAWIAPALTVVALLPAAAAHAATSAGGRAYELVSPANKNGGDIAADSGRTRAARDGNAIAFGSLAAFGDVIGTGVTTEYMAVRASSAQPGNSGWTTHAITPRVATNSFARLLGALQPLYMGEMSDNLDTGIFYSPTGPLTNDPSVAKVQNLYRRTDLRTPGEGAYDLITGCPVCDLTSTSLPSAFNAGAWTPRPAAWTPTFDKILFESVRRLTEDTAPGTGNVHLYQWDNATVTHVGRIPTGGFTECDDEGGPVCVAANASMAGSGAGTINGAQHRPSTTPHTISDGSDGHLRVFFTTPGSSNAYDGDVYMRIDGHRSVQLNVSEAGVTDPFPARFEDASVDGRRAFFSTLAKLTPDAPSGGVKLYMYDTTRAPEDANLTLVNVSDVDGGDFLAFMGASDDGHYVYMLVRGQLVAGELPLNLNDGYYLWHDGEIAFIGSVPPPSDLSVDELRSSGGDWTFVQRQSRVSSDGKHVLFSAYKGDDLLKYDQGNCVADVGCRELYVYSADTGTLVCASCDPSGATATAMTETVTRKLAGGSVTNNHLNRTFTDDGRYVFFNTVAPLVAEDTNRRVDAYEFDVEQDQLNLLSTGKETSDSWFMDASGDGRDAFIVTRQQLAGWDRDGAYDLYDARIGGGFPEPPAEAVPCRGDACQGQLAAPPAAASSGSEGFKGTGDVNERLATRRAARHCRRGFVKKRVRGKLKCKKKRHRTSPKPKRRPGTAQRSGS